MTGSGTAITLTGALLLWVYPMMWICVTGMSMLLLRQQGRRALDPGDIQLAVGLFTVGIWVSALFIVWLIPIALPIVMFNLVVPVIIAATYLTESEHRRIAFGAVFAARSASTRTAFASRIVPTIGSSPRFSPS